MADVSSATYLVVPAAPDAIRTNTEGISRIVAL